MKVQPLRQKLREATADAIVEAAEKVIGTDGPAASLQTIAEQAGVAVGTIYNYFSDRDRLIAEVFARRRVEMYDAIDSAAKALAQQPFEVQLTGFVQTVFQHFDARRDFLRIALETETTRAVIEKGADGRKRPAMQQLMDRADRIIRIGQREKRLREDGAHLFATVLVSIIKGVLIERTAEDKPLAPETDRVVQLFLHGVMR
jgi:AcrR family transcriptional regulator